MENTKINMDMDLQNLKQSFYIISRKQNSQDIHSDLAGLLEQGVPVIGIINPYENLHINTVEILEALQEKYDLTLLLKRMGKLEETPFIIKEYHERLNISGLSQMDGDSILYMAEDEIFFNLFYIGDNPLYTMDTIHMANNSNDNIGIVSTGDNFNISTFTLASQEIKGSTLEVSDYDLQVDTPSLVHKSFYYIGDIAIIFFIVSILILLAAISLFKKWSQENFLS